jgi:hypothetical protein
MTMVLTPEQMEVAKTIGMVQMAGSLIGGAGFFIGFSAQNAVLAATGMKLYVPACNLPTLGVALCVVGIAMLSYGVRVIWL